MSTPKAIGIKTVASSPIPAITAGHAIPSTFRAGDRIRYVDNSGNWWVRIFTKN